MPSPKPTPVIALNVRVEAELAQRFRDTAERRGLSFTQAAEQALRLWLAE